jgi:enoyl-CoA hydratase/carnithine racemase
MTRVRYEPRHPLGFIILDRPAAGNRVDAAMLRDLDAALAEAEQDIDAKVVVLRAEGPDFCVGADPDTLQPFELLPDPAHPIPLREAIEAERQRNRRLEFWFNFQRPTIAAVQGRCLGFGFHLAMASNLVFATEDARFGDPSVAMDQLPQQPLVILLVGPRVARDLYLTGRDLTAAEAEAMGLINRVVPRGELDAVVERYARAMARCPADGLAFAKESLAAMMEARGLGAAHRVTAELGVLAREVQGQIAPGEFDFRARVREAGLDTALAERDAVRGFFT